MYLFKGQSLAATQFTAQGYKLGMWPNRNKTRHISDLS
jgi:hypothetical protein